MKNRRRESEKTKVKIRDRQQRTEDIANKFFSSELERIKKLRTDPKALDPPTRKISNLSDKKKER